MKIRFCTLAFVVCCFLLCVAAINAKAQQPMPAGGFKWEKYDVRPAAGAMDIYDGGVRVGIVKQGQPPVLVPLVDGQAKTDLEDSFQRYLKGDTSHNTPSAVATPATQNSPSTPSGGNLPGYKASNGWGVTLQDTAKNVTHIVMTPPSTGNPMADALARPTELNFTKGAGSAKAFTLIGAAVGAKDEDYSKGSNWKGDVIWAGNGSHNSMRGGGVYRDRRGINLNGIRPQVQALEEAVKSGYTTANFDQQALVRFEKAGEYKPQ